MLGPWNRNPSALNSVIWGRFVWWMANSTPKTDIPRRSGRTMRMRPVPKGGPTESPPATAIGATPAISKYVVQRNELQSPGTLSTCRRNTDWSSCYSAQNTLSRTMTHGRGSTSAPARQAHDRPESRRGELNPRPAPVWTARGGLPRRRSTTKPLRQCGAQTSERHKYSPTNPTGIVRTTLCDSPRLQDERAWRVPRPSRVGGDDGAVYGSHGEGLRTPSSPPSRRQRSASGATSRGTPQARWPTQPES